MSNINSILRITKALALAIIFCLASCGGDQSKEITPEKERSEEVKHASIEKTASIKEKVVTDSLADSIEIIKKQLEKPRLPIMAKPQSKEKIAPKPKAKPRKTTPKPVSHPEVKKVKQVEKPAHKKIVNTEMVFRRNFFNYDTITQGDTIRHSFKFTNIGEHDLFIKDVKVSCGCTFPYYPKEAIAPGAKGNIDIVFNSDEKIGAQTSVVAVTANTEPSVWKLYIEGFVGPRD